MKGFNENKFKLRKENTIFFGFIIIYGFSLIYLSYVLNVWADETYTLNTTSRNLSDVIHQSYTFEAQLPLYFVLLSFWRRICSDIFFARLFSLIFIGLSAWVFSRLVQLISGKENTKWMVVIFLLNPFTIWAGLEIRLYAFLLFLSIITLYFFIRFFIENKNNYLYLFLFTSLIGLYTQYFFAVLIAALALSILVFKGWKAWLKFCLYLLPIALLFLPNLVFIPAQIKLSESQKLGYSTTKRFIDVFLYSPKSLMLGFNTMPFYKIIKVCIALIIMVLLIIAYYKWYRNTRMESRLYFQRLNLMLLILGATILLISLIFGVTHVDFFDRYLTIGFPILIIVFSLFKIYPTLFQRIIYGAISFLFVVLFFLNYRYPVKQYDYKSIAKYISKIEYNNEPILFYHSTISLPFTYYYKGHNPIVPLPHKVNFDTTYLDNVRDTLQLKQSIDSINTTSKSYLLISDLAEPSNNNNTNRRMVNDYISSHYNITMDTLYVGWSKDLPLRIRRFEKRQKKQLRLDTTD